MTGANTYQANGHQRTVVVMFDGLGLDYYRQSPLPTLKSWAKGGLFAEVEAVLPTVTNANNASICCGAWPNVHGIASMVTRVAKRSAPSRPGIEAEVGS